MRKATVIRKEYKAVCQRMDELMDKAQAAGHQGPVKDDLELYMSLYRIRITLEWVHPGLIKTS